MELTEPLHLILDSNQASIYLKYKTQIDMLINSTLNEHVVLMFLEYKFKLSDKEIELNSNISITEAIFISELIKSYCMTYKCSNGHANLDILEIGLAYGTSSVVMLCAGIQSNCNVLHDVIDPFQGTQWGGGRCRSHRNLFKGVPS